MKNNKIRKWILILFIKIQKKEKEIFTISITILLGFDSKKKLNKFLKSFDSFLKKKHIYIYIIFFSFKKK